MQKKRNFKIDIYLVVLLGIFLFAAVTNYIVLKEDTIPFTQDISNSYENSIRLNYHLFKSKQSSLERLERVTDMLFSSQKGVLLNFVTQPTYILGGISQDSANMTNIFFLLLLTLSVYGIGTILSSKKTGFVAATLCLLFPQIWSSSRAYLPILAQASLVCLNIFLLLKTEQFKNLKYSIFLGIALIITILTKYSFSIFLIGPFLAEIGPVVYQLIRKKSKQKKAKPILQVRNFGIAVLLFILSLFIYLPRYAQGRGSTVLYFNKYFFSSAFSSNNILPPGDSIIRFWLQNIEMIMPWYFWIFFLVGVVGLYLIKTKKKFLLLSWILIAFGIIMLRYSFNLRGYNVVQQMTAALPAAAIIIALFVTRINEIDLKGRLRKLKPIKTKAGPILMVLILFIGFFYYISINYFPNSISGSELKDYYTPDIDTLNYLGRLYPVKDSWDPHEVFELMENSKEGPKKVLYFTKCDEICWSLNNEFALKSFQDDLYLTDHCEEKIIDNNERNVFIWINYEVCKLRIRKADFIVFEEEHYLNDYGHDNTSLQNRAMIYQKWYTELRDSFTLLQNFRNFEGEPIKVFKRNQDSS